MEPMNDTHFGIIYAVVNEQKTITIICSLLAIVFVLIFIVVF